MTLPRTLIAILAAAALLAPSAQAQDVRSPDAGGGGGTAQAQPADGSTAQAHRQPAQDLRSPDARDTGTAPAPAAAAPGQATSPTQPESLPAPDTAPAPAAHDDGTSVPVLPLIAGALLVLLAAAVSTRQLARRSRRSGLAG